MPLFWRKKLRERVALFGGSFNPPHVGHTAICKWLFSRGLADSVWVIPCYQHPFSKGLEAFEHRFAMCRLAFGKLLLPVEVSGIEMELGGVSHTLRTVEHLKDRYPDRRFYLVTGDDVKNQLHDWHQFEKIRRIVDIINVPRGEGSPIPNVSSTEVRRRLDIGQAFADLVETEVAVYIVTKGLYRPRDQK